MTQHSIDPAFLRPLLKGRENESHKGDYGHLLLLCECDTMPGAAVLSTLAALRSGCGLVSVHSSAVALQAVAANCPSALLSCDPGSCPSLLPKRLERYSAVAVGRAGNEFRIWFPEIETQFRRESSCSSCRPLHSRK